MTLSWLGRLIASVGLVASAAWSQNPAPLGSFESRSDVGTVLHSGSAEFDPVPRVYKISGSGENMWAAAFVWKQVSSDVTLTADATIVGAGGDAHRIAFVTYQLLLRERR